MEVKVAALLIFYIIAINTRGAVSTVEDCDFYFNCSDDMDCSEAASCISDYESLESYVQNNKAIINNLTKAFYRTGHSPARFVRITYKLQIPYASQFNDSDENDTENDTCSSIERLYYWSTSPIYLLGPRPLAYLTLSAIIVQEENVIIQLPCLQATDQKALLSRLTYLVWFNHHNYSYHEVYS